MDALICWLSKLPASDIIAAPHQNLGNGVCGSTVRKRCLLCCERLRSLDFSKPSVVSVAFLGLYPASEEASNLLSCYSRLHEACAVAAFSANPRTQYGNDRDNLIFVIVRLCGFGVERKAAEERTGIISQFDEDRSWSALPLTPHQS